MGTDRFLYILIDRQIKPHVRLGSVAKPLKPNDWYTAREAAEYLAGEVTEATLKEYCKREEVEAKKVGPKQRWKIRGASIIELRRKWEIN
jgi:hypothetical protein